MRLKYSSVVLVFLIGILLFIPFFRTIAGKYAIQNATIVTVTGATIEKGTLIIDGDKIAAIGSNVAVPSDAEIIDASGLFVYPGLMDSYTTIGLSEIGAVAATQDVYELGTYNPHIKAIVAVNPHSEHIPITRVNGITTVLSAPRGAVISGQAALINLNGWTPEEMMLKAPAAICINFPRMPNKDNRRRFSSSEKSTPEKTKKQIKELKEVFEQAKRYDAEWEKYDPAKSPVAPDKNLMLAALVPVIKKELPVIIQVNNEKDIKNAVDFVDELGIKAIFLGVNDGWKTAELLKKHNIPVLVGPVLRSPGEKDPYDARFANAAVLHKAGVKIAFITGSDSDVRSLPYHAGTAAAFGLPKEEALKAVTIYPAEIFGVADQVGSLEVGKLANVIVTDGDPLEMLTQIKHVFITGEEIPLVSKHTKLYEKFKKRPALK